MESEEESCNIQAIRKATTTKMRRVRSGLLIAAAILFWIDGIQAGGQRITPAPSRSSTPTISFFPSVTAIPSVIPTSVPSFYPTTSAYPSTHAPTGSPSTSPSGNPVTPSLTPSMKPSLGLSEVMIPVLLIDFDINGYFEQAVLESKLRNFMIEVITSQARTLGDLAEVDLQVSTKVGSGNVQRTSVSNSKVNATIEGSAFFHVDTNPAPTGERLAEKLITYFSFWGDDDLIQSLARDNFTVSNLEVSTNGEFISNAGGKNSGVTNVAVPSNASNGSGTSAWLIAGLTIGCAVFVAAFAILVWQRRLRNARSSNSISHVAVGSTPMTGASPRSSSRLDGTPPSPQADNSYSDEGMVSLEDSLYTTETDQVYLPSKGMNDQYDAKRLDKVISNAYNFVAKHEDKTKST